MVRRILFIGLFCLLIALIPLTSWLVGNYQYGQGYRNGDTAGYKTGYGKGYTAGQSNGYFHGYDSGYQVGNGDGFISGHASGFSDGKDVGGVAYIYKNCRYSYFFDPYLDPSKYWICKKIP